MDLTKYENIFAQESEKYLKELNDFLNELNERIFTSICKTFGPKPNAVSAIVTGTHPCGGQYG